MRTLLLLMLASAPACAADAPAPASAESVKLVETVVKLETQDIPPSVVNVFLAVDVETLPKKLQNPYKSKKLELYTLKQLSEGKKKGAFRMPEAECAISKEAKSNEAGILKSSGYDEIEAEDVRCLMDRTKCTERELMCEFSLQIVTEITIGKDKKEKKKWRYFMHQKDPLMAMVAACRNQSGGQTNFFGALQPSCSH